MLSYHFLIYFSNLIDWMKIIFLNKQNPNLQTQTIEAKQHFPFTIHINSGVVLHHLAHLFCHTGVTNHPTLTTIGVSHNIRTKKNCYCQCWFVRFQRGLTSPWLRHNTILYLNCSPICYSWSAKGNNKEKK